MRVLSFFLFASLPEHLLTSFRLETDQELMTAFRDVPLDIADRHPVQISLPFRTFLTTW